MKCIIAPGNGCSDVFQANWYAWLQKELQGDGTFSEVILQTMPDPHVAHEAVWVPFLRDTLGAGADTVLIGHSSGAEAAMRLLETTPLAGCLLVSACWTDLGEPSEAEAGYYNRPWQWEAIKGNAKWILQVHSDDDPFIPIAEAKHVAENVGSDFHVIPGKQHFFTPASMAEVLRLFRGKVSAM
eukprot:NODE_2609_length_668_cov_60.151858_g2144_i0.p1 GENE.NODE_2609_length_668_cov_60.151858_g2144_i0~~NODE_2609_length_668_cov_60.151858_g2144_i0.p1  ORF type:complete len:184 (+),score=58.76 NODE_2609_length_668_cov_60.151858_g2144_i0:80-631(+)